MRIMLIGDRILGKSAYAKTGYEVGTRLVQMGHKVAHTPMGRANKMGKQMMDGILIQMSGDDLFSEDMVLNNYTEFNTDLMITLKDPWVLNTIPKLGLNWCPLVPVEHMNVSDAITQRLTYAYKSIAISRFGQAELRRKKVESVYIPHGVRTDLFEPLTPEEKVRAREVFGLPQDAFIILIVAMNRNRKGIPRMLRGFKRFRENNPDVNAHLMLWTEIQPNRAQEHIMGVSDVGVNLIPEIVALGINDVVHWADWRDVEKMGGLPDRDPNDGWDMRQLYGGADANYLCLPAYQPIIVSTPTRKQRKKSSFDRKRICHVEVGDQVLTHKGRFRTVKKVFKRKFDDELIEINPYYLNPVRVTPEHPVLVRRKEFGRTYGGGRFEWMPAKDLKKGDMIVVPKLKNMKHKRKRSMSITRNDQPHPARKNLPWNINFTPAMFRLFGWYVAEGTSMRDGVQFALNPEKEGDAIKDIQNTLLQELGLTSTIRTYNDKNVVQLMVYSRKLAGILGYHFGRTSHKKRIPRWMFELRDERRKLIPEFVRALWRGDGHVEDFGSSYTTVSRRLAQQLNLFLLKLNLLSSISKNKKRKAYRVRLSGKSHVKFLRLMGEDRNPKRARKSYNLHRSSQTHFFVPIKEIRKVPYQGLVYNLEVEEDNSYTTPICLHNCSSGEGAGLPYLESASMGVPSVGTNYAGAPEYVGPGLLVPWHDYVVFNTPGVRYALPDVDAMAEALAKIYNTNREKLGQRCRRFAESYDYEVIMSTYWKPFLRDCECELYPLITKEGLSSWA